VNQSRFFRKSQLTEDCCGRYGPDGRRRPRRRPGRVRGTPLAVGGRVALWAGGLGEDGDCGGRAGEFGEAP
jgi:hypothetical protein